MRNPQHGDAEVAQDWGEVMVVPLAFGVAAACDGGLKGGAGAGPAHRVGGRLLLGKRFGLRSP